MYHRFVRKYNKVLERTGTKASSRNVLNIFNNVYLIFSAHSSQGKVEAPLNQKGRNPPHQRKTHLKKMIGNLRTNQIKEQIAI